MSGGGGGGTTVTKTEPWEGAKPYYEDIMKKGQDAFAQAQNPGLDTNWYLKQNTDVLQEALKAGIDPTQFAQDHYKKYGMAEGRKAQPDVIAQPNALDRTAAAQLEAVATALPQNMGAGTRNTAAGFQQLLDDGFYRNLLTKEFEFDPMQDGLQEQVIDAAIRPVREQVQDQLIPQVMSQAILQGAYGGSRQDKQENQVIDEFGRNALDTTAKITYSDYDKRRDLAYSDLAQRRALAPQIAQTELNLASAIPGLKQTAIGLDLLPASYLGDAGAAWRGLDQLELDNDRALLERQYSDPFLGLSDYSSLIGLGGSGFNMSSKTAPGGSRASSILSGALGGGMLGATQGAGIAGALGSATPWMFGGPTGAAIGAGIGILGGLL